MAAEIMLAVQSYRGDSKKISEHLNKRFKNIATERVQEELKGMFARLDGAVNTFMDDSAISGLPGFEDRHKDFAISNEGKRRAIGGGAGSVAGTLASAGIYNWWNPVGWFAVAGALVAGAVATWGMHEAGAAIGASTAGVDHFRERIGDNIEDVEQAAHRIYGAAADTMVARAFGEPLQLLFGALNTFVADSEEALAIFEITLEKAIKQ
jgi:hypothetical protein